VALTSQVATRHGAFNLARTDGVRDMSQAYQTNRCSNCVAQKYSLNLAFLGMISNPRYVILGVRGQGRGHQMRNKPVVSTAKVRGLIKKNGIGYVDATRRNHPGIAQGISVWQLCSSVYFEVYGHRYDEVNRQEILKKFTEALAVEGLAVKESGRSFEIVSA